MDNILLAQAAVGQRCGTSRSRAQAPPYALYRARPVLAVTATLIDTERGSTHRANYATEIRPAQLLRPMGGSAKLRPEDWEQFEGEHGTLPSLVEKLITVYVKEVMTDGRDPSEDFVALIDKALETFDNNQNLPRQRAQIYLHFNQKDKAIDLYRKQLKRNASRYYLWAELAALVEDADTRLALTCMALSIKTKEDFLGKIRIFLAEQLCDRNEYALAAGQLALVRRCYERQGWHIPPTIAKVSDRIPAETAEADGRDFIRRHADEANIYLYDNAIHTTLVKSGEATDRKTQKRRWWAADADGNRYSLDPRRLHLPGKCPDGTAIKAVIADKGSYKHPCLTPYRPLSKNLAEL